MILQEVMEEDLKHKGYYSPANLRGEGLLSQAAAVNPSWAPHHVAEVVWGGAT